MIVDVFIDKDFNPVSESKKPNINLKYWAVKKKNKKNSYILFPLTLRKDEDEIIKIERK